MFDLKDLMSKVDTSQIASIAKKVGLSDEQASKITDYAGDAMKYRVNKEAARGKQDNVASLFSENANTDDDNKLASKMENDFAYNLTKKMGLPDSIASQLKGDVMSKIMSGVSSQLSSSGSNSASGILDKLGDNEMLDGFKKKFSNLF